VRTWRPRITCVRVRVCVKKFDDRTRILGIPRKNKSLPWDFVSEPFMRFSRAHNVLGHFSRRHSHCVVVLRGGDPRPFRFDLQWSSFHFCRIVSWTRLLLLLLLLLLLWVEAKLVVFGIWRFGARPLRPFQSFMSGVVGKFGFSNSRPGQPCGHIDASCDLG